MAHKTVIIDDLDGTEGAKTVTFSYQGSHYAIDLSEKHSAQMSAQFQKWIDAARRDTLSAPKKPTPYKSKSDGPDPRLQAIRDWANRNGFTVSYRGKIPQHVVDAFDAAHDAESVVTGKAPAFSAATS